MSKSNSNEASGTFKKSNIQQGENITFQNVVITIKKGVQKRWKGLCLTLSIASLLLALVSFATVVCEKMNYDLEVASTGIVLIFVGVLATFVVVSNYSQVADIQQRFMSAIHKNDERIEALNAKFGVEVEDFSEKLEVHKKETENIVQALNKRIEVLAASNLQKLDTSTYRLIYVKQNKLVEDWYILVIDVPINESNLAVFAKLFSEAYCKRFSNIHLVDDESVYPTLSGKWPPDSDDDFMNTANHFIAAKLFNTEKITMYPWKEFDRYKELGGENWKKDPPTD